MQPVTPTLEARMQGPILLLAASFLRGVPRTCTWRGGLFPFTEGGGRLGGLQECAALETRLGQAPGLGHYGGRGLQVQPP